MKGRVYLAGAGPGDPDLVTVRTAQLLAAADVVVYDALANEALLARCPPGCRRVYVGKRAGEHTRSQEDINDLLLRLANEYGTVVRLKGGDPFVFGRGGEEALALASAGVPFEVVPGITAGVAAPAFAGIPVTQRGVTSAVTFLTGHEDPLKPESDLNWDHLAQLGGTLVFYMGVGRMAENFRRLLDGGMRPDTPAAAVEWGTYPRQRTVVGTVGSLPRLAAAVGIGAPAITIVGDVVSLRAKISWYEARPLFGRRIVVTRARAQASSFAAALEELGAEVIQFPAIRIEPTTEPEELRSAAASATDFDWIVFTSVNGVAAFWAALDEAGLDSRALRGPRFCAIGPATAAAIGARGIRADLVPGQYVAEAVLEALDKETVLEGARILLPRADIARETLAEELRARGAEVTEIAAYRTVPDGAGAEDLRRRLAADEIDLITFTASSTVRHFVGLVGRAIGRAKVASIGPVTSATARELGLPVHYEAEEYTIPGLIRTLREQAATALG